jgi:hypothetical protein
MDKGLFQSIRDIQTRLGGTAAGKMWDAVSESMSHAITDIRQKVVEEPWFGRAVTPELVKQVDHTTVHGKTDGGVHGVSDAPTAGVHGGTEPTPKPGAPEAPGQPETSSAYREKVEGLFDPQNRQGQSFAEAVAERYGWGKDFWPMQKDIAEHGHAKDQTPEQDRGVER